MASFLIYINGEKRQVKVDGSTPLLWVLRDNLKLTGTKYGCGRGLCGACTVHIDGEATRSCITAIENAAGSNITTIEGLSKDSDQHVLVSLPSKMRQEVISRLLKVYLKIVIIRCKKPGLLRMCHSAVIASLVRS